MKIKKYRPNFFSGFDDIYYDVNSKEELLTSELCNYSIKNGYEICFSKESENYGLIMAIKQDKKDKEGAEWWMLAIITNLHDVEKLTNWLPSWNAKREYYKNVIQKNKQ